AGANIVGQTGVFADVNARTADNRTVGTASGIDGGAGGINVRVGGDTTLRGAANQGTDFDTQGRTTIENVETRTNEKTVDFRAPGTLATVLGSDQGKAGEFNASVNIPGDSGPAGPRRQPGADDNDAPALAPRRGSANADNDGPAPAPRRPANADNDGPAPAPRRPVDPDNDGPAPAPRRPVNADNDAAPAPRRPVNADNDAAPAPRRPVNADNDAAPAPHRPVDADNNAPASRPRSDVDPYANDPRYLADNDQSADNRNADT